MIKIGYDLDLELYKVGVVLCNSSRWKGLIVLEDEINKFKDILGEDEFKFYKYGILFIIDGQDPDDIDFFLNEEYERIRLMKVNDYELHKKLRLIKKYIRWLQRGDYLAHTILLNTFTDMSLRRQYSNWINMNEFDSSITFEQSKTISNEEWLKIKESNKMVKSHYDRMFNL